jgi:hypothetical protein
MRCLKCISSYASHHITVLRMYYVLQRRMRDDTMRATNERKALSGRLAQVRTIIVQSMQLTLTDHFWRAAAGRAPLAQTSRRARPLAVRVFKPGSNGAAQAGAARCSSAPHQGARGEVEPVVERNRRDSLESSRRRNHCAARGPWLRCRCVCRCSCGCYLNGQWRLVRQQ